MTGSPSAPSLRRARRAFWLLVVVSVLAVGALSDALSSPPAPATGLRVAGSGVLLIAAVALAVRVLLAADRATARARRAATSPSAQRAHRPWKRNPR